MLYAILSFFKLPCCLSKKICRQNVQAKTLRWRSLPEADLSLLLLLLLPDNLNEVSPLESPLLAARYLHSHFIIFLFILIPIFIIVICLLNLDHICQKN